MEKTCSSVGYTPLRLPTFVKMSATPSRPRKESPHKLPTTHPHPLTTPHWNVSSAWKDRDKELQVPANESPGLDSTETPPTLRRHCVSLEGCHFMFPVWEIWWSGRGLGREEKVKKKKEPLPNVLGISFSQTRVQLPSNQRTGRSGEPSQRSGLTDTQAVS